MQATSAGFPDGRLEAVVLVDMKAEHRGHLLHDDAFLARCLEPLARRVTLRSSTESVRNAKASGVALADPLPRAVLPGIPARLRYVLRALAAVRSPGRHIVFQSFDELAVLVAGLTTTKTFHLIVTNNLGLDRFERRPTLSRLALAAAFRRARSITVHSDFEQRFLQTVFPQSTSGKVYKKPFHGLATKRRIEGPKRPKRLVFFGPDLPRKPVEPVLELIRADQTGTFEYWLLSMREDSRPKLTPFEHHPNVRIGYGFTPNEDWSEAASTASAVVLTHTAAYEGRTSGSLADAVAAGTPVISRPMSPVDELFGEFGPMGLLLDMDDPRWVGRVLEENWLADMERFRRNILRCGEAATAPYVTAALGAALGVAAEERPT